MSAIEHGEYETTGRERQPELPPGYAPFSPRALETPRDSRSKSPALAAILSIGPGLGQVYVGYYPRGFVNIVVVAGIISILASTNDFRPYVPFLAIFLGFFWMYGIIDAARLAMLYNRALSGGREPHLPEGFQMPSMGGSILGGAILIAAAFVVLLHTRWGLRLDWVGEWWPVFPMIFGIWLVAKAVNDRKRQAGA